MSEIHWKNELAAVTAYFNPCRYRSRRVNYARFLEGLKGCGIKLLTMELAFGDDEFELEGVPDVIRVRASSILWQRERLLNLGFAELMRQGYTKLAWLDADILFLDPSWPVQLSAALDRWPVCQAFSYVLRHSAVGAPRERHPGLLQHYLETGHFVFPPPLSGFAWAFRADLMSRIRLYDRFVLGGADIGVAVACFLHEGNPSRERMWQHLCEHTRLNRWQQESFSRWANRFGKLVRGHVGAIPVGIETMFHGELRDRQYVERVRMLAAFDPRKDLRLNAEGCWEWATEKPQLHHDVAGYFKARREDTSVEADDAALLRAHLSPRMRVLYVGDGRSREVVERCAKQVQSIEPADGEAVLRVKGPFHAAILPRHLASTWTSVVFSRLVGPALLIVEGLFDPEHRQDMPAELASLLKDFRLVGTAPQGKRGLAVFQRREAVPVDRKKLFHVVSQRHFVELARQARRDRPRIFQIGFNRCGTYSLYEFFKQNGLRCLHWERGGLALTIQDNIVRGRKALEGVYEDHDFYADMIHVEDKMLIEPYKLFPVLDLQYPGSKFILNLRDREAWIRSRAHHGLERTFQVLTGSSVEEVHEYWRKDWDRHVDQVLSYFQTRGQDLLVYDIDSDRPEKMCEFFREHYALDPSHWGHHHNTGAGARRPRAHE